jgi:hypothetical protein
VKFQIKTLDPNAKFVGFPLEPNHCLNFVRALVNKANDEALTAEFEFVREVEELLEVSNVA